MAESLVYPYGGCDRAAVYPVLAESGPVPFRDRFTGRVRRPPERYVRAFTELTAANELDVVRHSPAMARQHGESLRDFFASVRLRLTDAAWQAWSIQSAIDPAESPDQGRPRSAGRHQRPGPPISPTGTSGTSLVPARLNNHGRVIAAGVVMEPVFVGVGVGWC